MGVEWEVREGTTTRIVFQLLAGGDAIDLGGVDHVELHMKDKKGKTYRYSSSDVSPKVLITDAANGKVGFDPIATSPPIFTQIRSPYRGYWLVYDTATTYYSVPEDSEFKLEVRGIY